MVSETTPAPLLVAEQVSRRYRLPRETVFGPAHTVHALSDVSFVLQAGQNLGIVGESGSGKSTLARLVMALERPDSGAVRFNGQDLGKLDALALRRLRSGFQITLFPYTTLFRSRKSVV